MRGPTTQKEAAMTNAEITPTDDKCAVGERVARANHALGKTPVLSCEGACIRGEIARLAANLIAQNEPYRRACHGEYLTVPASQMAVWVDNAGKVVLVDGCFLRCHGRILENRIGKDRLVQFDALSHYKKYTDRFDIDSVPRQEREDVARDVANWILEQLGEATGIASSTGAEQIQKVPCEG
jgi:hypothetical protein